MDCSRFYCWGGLRARWDVVPIPYLPKALQERKGVNLTRVFFGQLLVELALEEVCCGKRKRGKGVPTQRGLAGL